MTCEHAEVGRSNLTNPTIVTVIIGVLVERLGGKVTITQKDVDTVAYSRLIENVLEDGTLFFEVEEPKPAN